VPSHRDLHPRQVVLSGHDIGFIDLDDCALAPPGLDVGNMVAHLRREAVIGRRQHDVAARAVSAFLTGYGAEPPDLQAWVALALARLASLAETRHGRPAERDALLAELDGGAAQPLPEPAPTSLPVLRSDHPDRPVKLEERDGHTVVVKTYHRTDGEAIHEAMAGLWSSPLGRDRAEGPGMPEPLGFDARARELTMAFVPGEPLGDRGHVGGALSRGVEVGQLLADLHGSGVVVDRVRDRRALARSVARKVADVAADPTTPGAVVDAFVEASLAVERAWTKDDAPRRHVLSHGDLSPRNVLIGPRGLVLIDFDRVQMAEPERDLAYWAAWTWVTQGAHGWPDTAALLGDLVSGYAARSRRAPADRASLEVHLAVGLVRIAHGWTVLRHDAETQIRVLHLASALAGRHASPRLA
jgi:Ser/Thr protein kinase RdoA (MazF antagonist)